MMPCRLGFLVALSLISASDAFDKVAGYTPVSDISVSNTVGAAIDAVHAALKQEPRNFALAKTEYEKVPTGGISLRHVAMSPAPVGGDALFTVFSTHYGSTDYVHEFVLPALEGTGFALTDKAREELTMKGIVLQGVLMSSWSNLHKAIGSCTAGDLSNSTGAPHSVDRAWSLYASNENNGPIKLAEKRAPQFATEATPFTEAGSSKVNVRLLELFKNLQTAAQQGNCSGMSSLAKMSISQMQVPVIQGMLREAYEVDPKESETHRGADGFIEVVEGWAFARAVLPSIAACSASAAQKIKDNMDTIALGADGKHSPEGYVAVKTAVESTYECLGISCTDVNAMVNPFLTGQLLWTPCSDAALPAHPVAKQESISAAPSQTQLLTLISGIALMMPWL